ncbi:translation initiation factor IF-2-like [Zalophus californianus]|uniref:Translation initiation factor IF-2-like n=1 Tax=Zalophus californianus TaxID=9704 RepID=A0A6J2FI61_ZALCA|nr:translation initiation factor IF-2-like [Zalophus californianus]
MEEISTDTVTSPPEGAPRFPAAPTAAVSAPIRGLSPKRAQTRSRRVLAGEPRGAARSAGLPVETTDAVSTSPQQTHRRPQRRHSPGFRADPRSAPPPAAATRGRETRSHTDGGRRDRGGERAGGRRASGSRERGRGERGGRAPAPGRWGRAESQSRPRCRRAAHRPVPACAPSPSGGQPDSRARADVRFRAPGASGSLTAAPRGFAQEEAAGLAVWLVDFFFKFGSEEDHFLSTCIPPDRLNIPRSIPRPARSAAGAGCAKRIRVEICAPGSRPRPVPHPPPPPGVEISRGLCFRKVGKRRARRPRPRSPDRESQRGGDTAPAACREADSSSPLLGVLLVVGGERLAPNTDVPQLSPPSLFSVRNPAGKYMHSLRIARAKAQRYKV